MSNKLAGRFSDFDDFSTLVRIVDSLRVDPTVTVEFDEDSGGDICLNFYRIPDKQILKEIKDLEKKIAGLKSMLRPAAGSTLEKVRFCE